MAIIEWDLVNDMAISVVLCRISYIIAGVITWYFFLPIFCYAILIRPSLPLFQWKCSWEGHRWFVCCYILMLNSVLILCDLIAVFNNINHCVLLSILLFLAFWRPHFWFLPCLIATFYQPLFFLTFCFLLCIQSYPYSFVQDILTFSKFILPAKNLLSNSKLPFLKQRIKLFLWYPTAHTTQ